MTLSFALALLLAVFVTASQSAQMLPKSDLERLQGHWEGKGPGGACSVTISGNALRFQSRPDFWYETTFTLPDATGPRQLHATIVKDSSSEQRDIGTVVVALFKVESEALTLGVVKDFDGSSTEPIVGDWEDGVSDIYKFEKAPP